MAIELNIRQDRFLKALLETATIESACKIAGINKTTGYTQDRSVLQEIIKDSK